MGRRKQSRPNKSADLVNVFSDQNHESVNRDDNLKPLQTKKGEIKTDVMKEFYVEINQSYETLNRHLDIAEIVLTSISFAEGFSSYDLAKEFTVNDYSDFILRFRLCYVDARKFKLGHWPVIPSENVILEFVDKKISQVVFSGIFDGPDEGVSALVHLIYQKIFLLRPSSEIRLLNEVHSMVIRVEFLESAFNICGSLLERSRQTWKKSMMNAMIWLRPEVASQEAKYGITYERTQELDDNDLSGCFQGMHSRSRSRKRSLFDAAGFYEAIKRSKDEPMFGEDFPDFLPNLRPYQRRAVHWMIQREKGNIENEYKSLQYEILNPLCVSITFLDKESTMFYNPFSGNISLQPETSFSYVSGGILADEMGLGKTVELLACILANPRSKFEHHNSSETVTRDSKGNVNMKKRLKKNRVECICGALSESSQYEGLWVQCDACDAWQHADCVGYTSRRKHFDSDTVSKRNSRKNSLSSTKKRDVSDVTVVDGDYFCPTCIELIETTNCMMTSGATLIVCPAPILRQWHAEITRHIKSGTLRICIYGGVRNLNSIINVDTNELASADIVLTTYDVLKEDVSHDFDRHDGDQRVMRFQKRYPVLPTPLTRIHWWRICLDEAQMVENNTASATEMALRLHAQHRWCITGTPIQRRLDDLYGLLRFLGASPYNISGWWIEVIRDPYERGDFKAIEFTHRFFKSIMWRSSKLHVSNELQLPPQEERISWLCLSPIEAHFYQRQHETCAIYAQEVISNFRDNMHKEFLPGFFADSFLSHNEASKLLYSLLKLRQACCHPQVGSSGLRSLQKTPMTMEEILLVLIGKAKIEGEENLRKLVVALNGLAGIAAIEKDIPRAISLYKEALSIADDQSDDFRLDPLLNLHIHHNLDELLSSSSKCVKTIYNGSDENPVKKQKLGREHEENGKGIVENDGTISSYDGFNINRNYLKACNSPSDAFHSLPDGVNDPCLRVTCDNIKKKYLSSFISKLSLAQEEFKSTYMQICTTFREYKSQHASWWCKALDVIEQSKESSHDFIRKIDETIFGDSNRSRPSKFISRFRNISGLKCLVQTGLDSLETSRQILLQRLLEIDETMVCPRDEDILRVRYCSTCNLSENGPTCVHCQLDELFQVYGARLFRFSKGDNGGVFAVPEEVVNIQKKRKALKRFLGTLSNSSKSSQANISLNENMEKRCTETSVMVSRSPSELELILSVLKSYTKGKLGREVLLSSRKHLLLLEAMRKEYVYARNLAFAQDQILRAHDEIKMATSRLRLKDDGRDTSSVDALSLEELTAANFQFSSEKFTHLSSLLSTKGQLRYLKGLMLCKKTMAHKSPHLPCFPQDAGYETVSPVAEQIECISKDEEACPICHEKLSDQKMVFQCGHVTCCKCFVILMDRNLLPNGKSQGKWVMCPTCRQHTDFGDIAYVDDRLDKLRGIQSTSKNHDASESSINVKGSYGTKIEAITRRILWIKFNNPEEKVLVFSSWNDVLDVLEHALDANSIHYIRMRGGRKSHISITEFKGLKHDMEGCGKIGDYQYRAHKSFQVLLLLIQHGANGLNILEAQHVILVEPLLNPATEAQAISRIHRIGQDKTTYVHRFIVKDTVEESIYKLNKSKSLVSVMNGKNKNLDQTSLSLKDVECLFASPPTAEIKDSNKEQPGDGLRHLPPTVAAALAAEKRFKSQKLNCRYFSDSSSRDC